MSTAVAASSESTALPMDKTEAGAADAPRGGGGRGIFSGESRAQAGRVRRGGLAFCLLLDRFASAECVCVIVCVERGCYAALMFHVCVCVCLRVAVSVPKERAARSPSADKE